MRGYVSLLAVPLCALAACGGGGGAGPETIGSVAPPAGTGSGGTGGGVGTTPTPTPGATGSFLAVTSPTTFNAVGSAHSFEYTTTNGATSSVYLGNASTVRAPSGTIAYSPRDGVFTIALNDANAGTTSTVRFQDPAHRSDFNPERTPTLEVPNLTGFNYLSAGNSLETSTLFYQRPDSTLYVTLAGFARRVVDTNGVVTKRERGVYAFGAATPQTQVPISGTGTYTGGFLATSVLNPTGDSTSPQPNYMQWISGSSRVDVDFGRSTVALSMTGQVGTTFQDGQIVSDASLVYPSGTIFTAAGRGTIDLVRSGGFTGAFDSAAFQTGTAAAQAVDFRGISAGSSTAGASSFDGGFFGPNAVNLGGNFRIVGGVPDQRVDIHGAFAGGKN